MGPRGSALPTLSSHATLTQSPIVHHPAVEEASQAQQNCFLPALSFPLFYASTAS